MLPYLFGSMGMQAVGRAGGAVVIEARRQFKISGIMKRKQKPDYAKLVDLLNHCRNQRNDNTFIVTSFISNCIILIIFAIGGQAAALASVGAMLLGVIITGLFVAVSMTAMGGVRQRKKIY